MSGVPYVVAGTPGVQVALTAIADIILAQGGRIHPGLCVFEAHGQLTVRCDGIADHPGPLFDIPRELLVPIDGATWADDPARLTLLAPPPGLTPIQRELLDLHIALYNAAGKIPWLIASHPKVALREHAELVAAMRAVRPGFGEKWLPTAETFLATRTFHLDAIGEDAQGIGEGQSVLLPLVDCLNHHPEGASLSADARAMTVAVARPRAGAECFAHYGGRRDTLDMALHYGFVDRATHWARSAPVAVDVADIGRIEVQGQRRRATHPFDPPTVSAADGGLTLSHLTFDERHPQRVASAVGLVVTGYCLTRGLSRERAVQAAERAVQAIAEANHAALSAVSQAAIPVRRHAFGRIVIEAVGRQRTLICDAATLK